MNTIYPSDDDLKRVENWNPQDPKGLFDFVENYWNHYGKLRFQDDGEKHQAHLATGGWSGNEEIISAMQANQIFWSLYWQSSHRGGKFVFNLPRPK